VAIFKQFSNNDLLVEINAVLVEILMLNCGGIVSRKWDRVGGMNVHAESNKVQRTERFDGEFVTFGDLGSLRKRSF
jgi:hypothetical protein